MWSVVSVKKQIPKTDAARVPEIAPHITIQRTNAKPNESACGRMRIVCSWPGVALVAAWTPWTREIPPRAGAPERVRRVA